MAKTLRGDVEGYASLQFFRLRCRPEDSIPDYRSTLDSGEGIDLDIASSVDLQSRYVVRQALEKSFPKPPACAS